MNDWCGRTLGGYQIVEEIGRGGVAVVYRAYQPQLDRWVAIKILRTADSQREEFLVRFRREAKAIAALRHPNILTVYDYGEEGGIAYIVMEYVPGGSLKDRLTGESMAWSDVAKLTIPVGRALAYAHSQGIVHRDIKPANILLGRSDWPFLADFGLVKLLGRQRGITKPGTAIGSPAYFSPEQAIGEGVDHRSDIYGMGIVLYELLTGHVPFESDSPYEVMLRRLRELPVPPTHFNAQITPDLEAVIMRALARKAEDRYPTMEALVSALLRLPDTPGRYDAASSRRRDDGSGCTTTRLSLSDIERGPRLVMMGTGMTFDLADEGEVLIGRSDPRVTPDPDVDLAQYGREAGVSRRHARLICRAGDWFVKDLDSTNGTFLGQTRLTPNELVRIHDEDVIRCGQLTLIFYEE